MAIQPIPGIDTLNRVQEVRQRVDPSETRQGPSFTDALKDAVRSVDDLQQQSESAQVSWARGDDVDLHDVLIKIEEAEIAFKAMMEVRNKLIEAYHEVMRIGSGG